MASVGAVTCCELRQRVKAIHHPVPAVAASVSLAFDVSFFDSLAWFSMEGAHTVNDSKVRTRQIEPEMDLHKQHLFIVVLP